MGPATQTFTSTEPLSLYRGGTLPGFTLAWERWGTLNEDKSNAVLVLGGLSASAHAAASHADPSPGWWQGIIGPGAAIDTNRFYVICINALGSCFGSTGPASVNPHTQTPWRLNLPELAMEDTAQAAHSLITELGIKHAQDGVDFEAICTPLALQADQNASEEAFETIANADAATTRSRATISLRYIIL